MWTTEFKCYENSQTVGTIKATCNQGLPDCFIFESTINLDDKNSVDDFILKAKAAKIKSEEPLSTVIVNELNNINQKLNK